MDEETGKMILQVARTLAAAHPYRCGILDQDDLAMIAVERAVAKAPLWDSQQGALLGFLRPYMEGAICSYLRTYSKGACKTQGYSDRDTRRFGALVGDTDLIPGDVLPGRNLDRSEMVDIREELEQFRHRHWVSLEDYQLLLLYYGNGLSLREVGEVMHRSEDWAKEVMKRLVRECPGLPKPSAAYKVYAHTWKKRAKPKKLRRTSAGQ